MRKKVLFFIIFIFALLSIFADEIMIAPIIVYDKKGDKLEIDISKKVYQKLSSHWFDGQLDFELLRPEKYGMIYTGLDAAKVCTVESKRFMIYGYVQKNDFNWFANLKIYDSEQKKIIKEIFAGDEINYIERFENDIFDKLIQELEKIIGIQNIEKKTEEPLKISVPTALYYWSPLSEKWNSVYTGLVGAFLGIEFYPPQKEIVLISKKIDFTFRFYLTYYLGIGKPNMYPLNLNVIQVGLPCFINLHFNEKHSMYFGLGMFYEIEIMNIIEKYQNQKMYFQNVMGLENILGYKFHINQYVDLFSEFNLNFQFNQSKLFLIKPTIGVTIKL